MMNVNFFYRHTKRMVVALVASACALSLTVLPALAADENTTPTQNNIVYDRCNDEKLPKNYFWIASSANQVMKLTKVEIKDTFDPKDGATIVGDWNPPVPDHNLGDIAIVPDASAVYAIEFSTADKGVRLVKWNDKRPEDDFTETFLVSADKTFTTTDSPTSGWNALSVSVDGKKLLTGTYLDKYVYEINPDDHSYGEGTSAIKKLDAYFPISSEANAQLVSGGDFVILPDNSLIGLSRRKGDWAYLVKWDPATDASGEITWKGVGKIIGKVPKSYGMARVGSHLLLPGVGFSSHINIYDVNLGNASSDEPVPILFDEKSADKEKYPILTTSYLEGYSGDIWGASSSGDGGLASTEGLVAVKTVFSDAEKDAKKNSVYRSGRKDDNDQVKLGSQDYCVNAQFNPPVVTKGIKPGLQKDKFYSDFVKRGSWRTVSEDFVNETMGKDVVNRLPFYNVTLACKVLNKNGEETSDAVDMGPIKVTDARASAAVKVSDQSGYTTVCTFTNTPLERPRAFPLTGATTNGWQLLGAVGVLAAFAVFPVVSVVRKRKVQ